MVKTLPAGRSGSYRCCYRDSPAGHVQYHHALVGCALLSAASVASEAVHWPTAGATGNAEPDTRHGAICNDDICDRNAGTSTTLHDRIVLANANWFALASCTCEAIVSSHVRSGSDGVDLIFEVNVPDDPAVCTQTSGRLT